MSCSGAFPHGLASSFMLAIKVGSTRTWAAGLNTRPGSGGVMVASGDGSFDLRVPAVTKVCVTAEFLYIP